MRKPVIDLLNALSFDNHIDYEEKRLCDEKIKNIAAKSQTVVFVIYNLSIPKQRGDMRPMLRDFPSDSYYRLFDVIQLLYKPDLFFMMKMLRKVWRLLS